MQRAMYRVYTVNIQVKNELVFEDKFLKHSKFSLF